MFRLNRLTSECSPAGEEVEDKDDDGENEKDMDPAAQGVTANESYYPEKEKDDGDRPKHCCSPQRLPVFTSSGSPGNTQNASGSCIKVRAEYRGLPVRIKYELST